MRSIEWCHFAMTLSDPQHRILDHDITQSQVSRKQYKMELQLQCIGQMGSRIIPLRNSDGVTLEGALIAGNV